MPKPTPFHDKHLAAGGKMVEFAGYELPVRFRGIIPEHKRVRTTVGVFDVSHMGRLRVFGSNAQEFVNRMTTNDTAALAPNQAQYSVLCYPDGGIVDDLVVYRLDESPFLRVDAAAQKERYLLVVNGANNERDTAWLNEHIIPGAQLENVTDEVAQLAIQGPKAEQALAGICSFDLSSIGFYHSRTGTVAGVPAFVSRTGYTGEDGFEVYFPAEHADKVWDAVFEAGHPFDIEPIGLGARDTLRLEMKMALYGNDIDHTTNPIEAGLGWVVRLDKPAGFIGDEALRKVQNEKPDRRLVCLEMTDNSIPRPHYTIHSKGKEVGHVTSGTKSPSLERGIALGYVRRDSSRADTELEIEIRGRLCPCRVVKPPFYKHGSRK